MTKTADQPRWSSELEARIARGDRDAMAQLLATALSRKAPIPEMRRLYDLVWEADHGADSMVMRNMAIVSAASQEFRKTEAYAKDFEASGLLVDAFHAALALRIYGSVAERDLANQIITRLAEKGHIRSQVTLRAQAAAQGGLFSKIGFQLFRLCKIFQALVLSAKDPKNPRAKV